jgi:hypothetical protein
MAESLEWLTDIIEAHDGTEQRIRVRQEPRQIFEASVLLNDQTELSKLRVAIAAWQHREWGWPCWHEGVTLGESLGSGAWEIPIDTTCGDFRPGGYAIIHVDPTHYEVVQIDYVDEFALGLYDATTMEHPAGAAVMPLRMARMAAQASRDDHTVPASRYGVIMQVTDNIELTTEPAIMQYLGYDVLSDPLLMPGETMPRQFDRPIDVLDPGPGAWATESRTDYPRITTDHRWALQTPAQAWAFRRWLHRRAGMCNPVWIPSRTHDLALAAQPDPMGTVLVIHDVNYRNVGLGVPGMTHIAVFFTSGAIICRRITDAEIGEGGTEVLTMDDCLGDAPVACVSFLNLHRFHADRITLTWNRGGRVTCLASMVTACLPVPDGDYYPDDYPS